MILERGRRLDVAVRAAVAAVGVAERRRRQQRVVERRVEDRLAGCVRRLDPDALELALPGRGGVPPVAVELPARRFALEVPPGAIHTHRRDPHLQQQRLPRAEDEPEQAPCACRLDLPALGRVALGIADQPRLERRREPRHEEHALVLRPALRKTVPRDGRRAFEGDLRLDRLVAVDGEAEVERHGRLAAGRRPEEGVPVQADAPRGGQLRADVERLQIDRVVARRRFLLFVRERRRDGRGHLRARLRRRDEDVAQIANPGAAQVGVAEPGNLGVGVVIARAPVPALFPGIGAELHQAAGHRRTREGVAMAAGADERIHVLPQRLAGRDLGRRLLPRLGPRSSGRPQAGRRCAFQHTAPGDHRSSATYVS